MQRELMLNPGPTNVHDDVRQALLSPCKNHRDASFASVLKSVRQGITNAMEVSRTHTCIPFVASGTGANEAVLANVGGPIAVLVNGRYSERLARIAEALGMFVVRIVCDSLEEVNLDVVNARLAAHDDLTHLCVVHHETTTGTVLPLTEISRITETRGIGLIVDGITSIFGQDLGRSRGRIDYFTVTANKCLESVPGLSFVVARRSLLDHPGPQPRSYYFDLRRQYESMETLGAPAFTQSYAAFRAAELALQRLARETVAGRIARYKRLRVLLQKGLAALGIFAYPLPAERQSSWLQLYLKPPALNFINLHDRLLRRGISIYTDEETLSKGHMYFATMGAIDDDDVRNVVEAITEEHPFAMAAHRESTVAHAAMQRMKV